ncbi:hypothetical protein [Peribacillus sp. NPDC101480]
MSPVDYRVHALKVA